MTMYSNDTKLHVRNIDKQIIKLIYINYLKINKLNEEKKIQVHLGNFK